MRADLLVARRAEEEWGVLSLDELRQCGITRAGVSRRSRSGRLHRLHRGVYAVGHANVSLEGRFLAAVKACGPSAVLSHRSAAALWGLLDWDDRHPEITVVRRSRPTHDGIRVHRSDGLDRRDLTRCRGIPVTTPARTVVDLAAQLPAIGLRRLVREAQGRRLVSIPKILDALERAGRKRGVGRLRRLIATGPAPTRSELEDVVLDLILRGGLEHPDVNVPIVVAGRRIVPDWPAQRLIVEADGMRWHQGMLAREDDSERQALLGAPHRAC